jgi:hypothetical protein
MSLQSKVVPTVIALILSVAISACASVYRSPGSESLSPSEIAVIDHKNPLGSDTVIEDIDGKWRGVGIIKRYELSPGEHSITVAVNKYGYTGGKITGWFQAQAGRVYVIDAILDTTAMRWGISITDKELGRRVDYRKPMDE